eukprot:Gregarina_sp_Poly_1__5745@NODE_301_length_9763_cov_48_882632_g260_i0_p2_GENE_NODE_301_length_9763_cov_48_882632_g260_i0NODE_301_length_9763_cov_48_882632_g260_i0_p2_ORF_typecomplete_len915_score155_69ALMT/PF11744_8/4e08FUSC/PF04632_12/2_2e05FUSC_2/PF13515_6/3_9e05ArAE_2_N/PF10337_9/9_8e02ArAE_2_N/PF10337_9/0_0001DUF1388/PF07142_12/0_52ArAE_1/PF06081_11/0_56_NODE_301_length_9763_cov_48_882632_g260_i011673911
MSRIQAGREVPPLPSETLKHPVRKVGFEREIVERDVTTAPSPSRSYGKDKVLDPTYSSAQKMARLSTMEVMTLLRRTKQAHAESGSEEPLGNDLSTERIEVPKSLGRREHIRFHLFRVRRWIKDQFSDWARRNVPHTLDQNRLGIQWVVCLLFSSSILWIDGANQFFSFAIAFCMISCVTVFDPTWGGNLYKSIDRFLAVVLSTATAFLLFVPLHFSSSTILHSGIKWTSYAFGCLHAFFWCYWQIKKPAHLTLYRSGIASSAGIFSMLSDQYLESTWKVAICNFIGIIAGTLVFGLIFPKSARAMLRRDLVIICDKIGQALEPLVEFDAGVVSSASFFRRRASDSATGGGLLKRLTKGLTLNRKGASKFSSGADSLVDVETIETVDVWVFEQFRKALWTQIQSIYTLLDAQGPLMAPAARELSLHAPHRFPLLEYRQLFNAVKRLFYHVVSLYLVLDTQSAAIRDDAVMELLGDRWAWAGVGLRIGKGDGDSSVKDSTGTHTEFGVQKHWSVPNSGLGRHMTRFEIKRQSESVPALLESPGLGQKTPSPKDVRSVPRLEPLSSNLWNSRDLKLTLHTSLATNQSTSPTRSASQLHTALTSPSCLQSRSLVSDKSSVSAGAPVPAGSLTVTDRLTVSAGSPVSARSPASAESPAATDRLTASAGSPAASCKFLHKSLQKKTSNRPPAFSSSPLSDKSAVYFSASPAKEGLRTPEASPQKLSPHSLEDSRHRLSLVSVLSELSQQSAGGAGVNDIINSSPVMRWAEVYGPLIGRVSKHVALAVSQFGSCLQGNRVSEPLEDHISLAEEALGELAQRRVLWFRTVQILLDAHIMGTEDTHEEIQEHIDEYLFRRWMGVSHATYHQLTPHAQANFWEAFGNIQDRLSTTIRTLMGLLVELKACRQALGNYVLAAGKS